MRVTGQQASLDRSDTSRKLLEGKQTADVVIGSDAVWDVLASDAAGLPRIGFGSSGIYANHLRAAGALGDDDGPRDLLDQLGDSPLARRA